MFRADALRSLDHIPTEEALRRPIDSGDTPARRIAMLLGGEQKAMEATTVGDVLFRWARTEPDALQEAEISSAARLSEIVAATGRLPKRLGLGIDFQRAASAGTAALGANLQFDPRTYLLSRLVAHLHEAQGCEASIGWAGDDPTWVLINGLGFVVQDPSAGPPSYVEQLTLVPQDLFARAANLAGNPLVYAISGITSSALADILPPIGMAEDILFTGLQLSAYASAAAQAARLILRQDTDGLLKLSSFVGTAAAGHLGHVAGQAAAVALFGLAGSWMVVLAPIASGVAGRAIARNFARRARFVILCRKEVSALQDAIRHHCAASRDVLEANIQSTTTQSERFSGLYQAADGPAKATIADWLQRVEHIQTYRKLIASRLDRAIHSPTALDRRDGDPLAAAHESLLICARSGVHPANVRETSQSLVAASLQLQQRMSLALI